MMLVANARGLVKLVGGLLEQTPGEYPEGITLDEADGNSVVLDLGGGNYLNYAHMQKGSPTRTSTRPTSRS